MTKNIVIGVLAAATLLFGYFAFSSHSVPLFGAASGTQHYQEEGFQGGLQIGQRGSDIKNVLKGTCSLIASSYSLAASTSVAMDCAVTGALSGDLVMAQFATSTASAGGPGWEVVGASASSTSGFITLSITNGTGATAVIPRSVASTTQYVVIR